MPSSQTDLFAQTHPQGFTLWREAVDQHEAAELQIQIDEAGLSPFRFQRWLGKRVTASFGWHYDFERQQLTFAEAIPDWLLTARTRAAVLAGLAPVDLRQILATRYDPGAGIGWHRDRPSFGIVLGLSLGAPAELRFRRRRDKDFDRMTIPLPARSLYLLSGEARWDWEHSIAPVRETRWSLTFRTLRRQETASPSD